MVQMSRLTDYGIVLMTHCARHADRSTHNARDLAAEAHLPLPTVGKILKALTRKGLLLSQRGVKGGYGLARSPEDITVAEIISALEGPVAITKCSQSTGADCGLERLCPVRTNWQRINSVVWEALGKITLHEMAQPLPPRDFIAVHAGDRPAASTGSR